MLTFGAEITNPAERTPVLTGGAILLSIGLAVKRHE